jgi:PAS domain S-box-containing protein
MPRSPHARAAGSLASPRSAASAAPQAAGRRVRSAACARAPAAKARSQTSDPVKLQRALRQAEAARRGAEETTRALLDAALHVACLLACDGTILATNDRLADSLGCAGENLVGANALALFPRVVARRRRAQLERAVASGQALFFEDVRNGRHFASSFLPVHDADGRVTRVVVFAQDITARKEAEARRLEYERQLQDLAGQLCRAEEAERRRLAADLHDGLCQTLVGLKMRLRRLEQGHAGRDAAALPASLLTLLDGAIAEARTLVFSLSPPVLYEVGVGAAVAALAAEFGKCYGIAVSVANDAGGEPLPTDLRVVLFRAVRELLANVAKHARARQVRIALHRDGSGLRIEVDDDGQGFAGAVALVPAGRARAGGFGLFNIRERLRSCGGRLALDSAPGRGTRVTLWVPLLPVGRDAAV